MTFASSNNFTKLPASTVTYRVGGRSYPLLSVKGCIVCESTYRVLIENLLLKGASYKAINDHIPRTGLNEKGNKQITSYWIKKHVEGKHLPLEEEARRAIIERQATEMNLSVIDADKLIDHKTFLKMGIQDVFNRMANREIEPDIKDGIAMSKLIMQMEYDSEERTDDATFHTTIRVLMSAARAIMTSDQYQQYSLTIMNNPEMAQLMAGPMLAEPVIDAEVEEAIDNTH
jgi:hypothetical protein